MPLQPKFSQRQLEAIEALGRCQFDPKEAAKAIGINLSTLNTHLRRARKKAGMSRSAELWKAVMDDKKDLFESDDT
jgi:DNA-binding CsgD family transcriptional regulator